MPPAKILARNCIRTWMPNTPDSDRQWQVSMSRTIPELRFRRMRWEPLSAWAPVSFCCRTEFRSVWSPGYILSAGPPTTENFFSFVISHGSFELTAIVISGGGGFVLAQGILFPGQRTRMDSLRHHGLESLKLALGAGAMLAIAAMLEGYFSPLPIAGRRQICGRFLPVAAGDFVPVICRPRRHRK